MFFNLNDSDSVAVTQSFLRGAQAAGKVVGLTSGSFDLIHFHHLGFLMRCRWYCDYLLVGVDSDESVRQTKGPTRPVIHDLHRVIMVDNLKPVAFAFLMNGVHDFGQAAELFTPDVIFRNGDFKGRETEIVGRQHARQIVIIEDRIDLGSTTEIIEQVKGKI